LHMLNSYRYAQEIIDLFDRNNTLSEFNSGTYTGVSLFGLTLWCKYLPEDSIMAQHGPSMVKHTWSVVKDSPRTGTRDILLIFSLVSCRNAVSELWHPTMKNMAGPWDRAYGYDMQRYLSLMALWFWVLIGKENSSLISKVWLGNFVVMKRLCELTGDVAASHVAQC
jgi:hypothetical protein